MSQATACGGRACGAAHTFSLSLWRCGQAVSANCSHSRTSAKKAPTLSPSKACITVRSTSAWSTVVVVVIRIRLPDTQREHVARVNGAAHERGGVLGLGAVEEEHHGLLGVHLDARVGESGPLFQRQPGILRRRGPVQVLALRVVWARPRRPDALHDGLHVRRRFRRRLLPFAVAIDPLKRRSERVGVGHVRIRWRDARIVEDARLAPGPALFLREPGVPGAFCYRVQPRLPGVRGLQHPVAGLG